MLLVPERQLVLILVPRTGSGALHRAVRARYPRALMPYRHMEADGVPHGYDHWRKIAVIRHPLDRLWSLYNFLQTFDGSWAFGERDEDYANAQRASVSRPFESWLIYNREVFSSRLSRPNKPEPFFTQRHPLPENLKSQWHYARPDLGTECWAFENLDALSAELDLPALDKSIHRSQPTDPIEQRMLPLVEAHIEEYHSWDLEWCRANRVAA